MTEDEVRAMLRDHIAHCYGSQREAARIWGISPTFVNMVLLGKRLPTEPMLTDLGLERITTYRRTDQP